MMGEEQHHTGLNPEVLEGVHYFLLGGSCGRIRDIIAENRDHVIDEIPAEYDYERALTWAVLKDKKLGFKYAVATNGMGPGSIEIFLPELLLSGEAPLNIIRIGTAGTMRKDVRLGDVAIATGAVRADGTSFKYATSRNDTYVPLATPKVVAALEQASKGYRHHVGVKVTKDSLWWEIFETPMSKEAREFAEYAAEEGVVASSMESSVLYTIADRYSKGLIFPDGRTFREVNAGTIVTIVNSPAEEEGEEALFSDDKSAIKAGDKVITEIGMEALRNLYRNDDSLQERTRHYERKETEYTSMIIELEDKLHQLHPMWSQARPIGR